MGLLEGTGGVDRRDLVIPAEAKRRGKTMQRFKVLFAAILVAATAAAGGDFSGKWSGKLITDGGDTIPGYLILQQKGDDLTGTAGPTAEQQVAIQNGRIQGGAASSRRRPALQRCDSFYDSKNRN